jgi:hypothetical protein
MRFGSSGPIPGVPAPPAAAPAPGGLAAPTGEQLWSNLEVTELHVEVCLEDTGCRIRYLIRDRDGKYPALFDTILSDAGIEVVLSGVRMPRINSIMERWIQACRHELLDRTLIFNQAHLLHALREYERHHDQHRPHRGIADTRPLTLLPEPITGHDRLTHLNIRRRDRLGGVLHEYEHAA